ncbi:hypothetical protein [Lysinibacillus xylanilyticus]|uniref:hypothetical protein n=1 Tax=Lysinibacillus xylanilyticus TaxID=582475 RepID=UPI0036DA7A7C
MTKAYEHLFSFEGEEYYYDRIDHKLGVKGQGAYYIPVEFFFKLQELRKTHPQFNDNFYTEGMPVRVGEISNKSFAEESNVVAEIDFIVLAKTVEEDNQILMLLHGDSQWRPLYSTLIQKVVTYFEDRGLDTVKMAKKLTGPLEPKFTDTITKLDEQHKLESSNIFGTNPATEKFTVHAPLLGEGGLAGSNFFKTIKEHVGSPEPHSQKVALISGEYSHVADAMAGHLLHVGYKVITMLSADLHEEHEHLYKFEQLNETEESKEIFSEQLAVYTQLNGELYIDLVINFVPKPALKDAQYAKKYSSEIRSLVPFITKGHEAKYINVYPGEEFEGSGVIENDIGHIQTGLVDSATYVIGTSVIGLAYPEGIGHPTLGAAIRALIDKGSREFEYFVTSEGLYKKNKHDLENVLEVSFGLVE